MFTDAAFLVVQTGKLSTRMYAVFCVDRGTLCGTILMMATSMLKQG